MALIAVVYVLLYTELLQCEHTTYTEKNLLLQTVLPVTSIESVCDRTVELRVHVIVCIEEIELHAAYICCPYRYVNHIVHIRNVNNKWLTCCWIKSADNRERVEVLCIIVCYLLALHRY